MKRIPAVVLMLGLVAGPVVGQSLAPNTDTFPDKPELLRRIGLYETAILHAEQAHSRDPRLAAVYISLGGLYEVAAMNLRAEDSLARGIALIRGGVPGDLAAALVDMGALHIEMQQFRKAEREEREALDLRTAAGDQAGIAQSWCNLATLYLKEKRYDQAIAWGEKALARLTLDAHAKVLERLQVRQTLGNAFCMTGQCDRAVPLLRDGLQLARAAYGEDSPPTALAYYLLGYVSWKAGDRIGAQAMERGLRGMKPALGWGHPAYVQAMSNYAQFLRETGEPVQAARVESDVKQAQAVVDVRSFTHRPATP